MIDRKRFLFLTLALMVGCSGGSEAQTVDGSASPDGLGLATATFGGGCFWCVEEAFDKVDGVVAATSGYMGGHVANPSYEQVSSGRSGHVEVVQVTYDPDRVSYEGLLNAFWTNVDPFTPNQQFCDHGEQYRSVIFVDGPEQRRSAERSKAAVAGRFDNPIATDIEDATAFYPAEEYHQDYYHKNPLRYRFYKYTCGRAQRLEEIWGDS